MYRRVTFGLVALALVMMAGTVGYILLGFSFLDALYQTVTTITTVGFREIQPLSTVGKLFTICLILVGVGTALYTFSMALETLIDGHIRDLFGRRRMERHIRDMKDHVIICGWGRVGRSIARYVTNAGHEVVVIDRNPERIAEIPTRTCRGTSPTTASCGPPGSSGPGPWSPLWTPMPPTSTSP